jgi:pilus assembly protein CpaB
LSKVAPSLTLAGTNLTLFQAGGTPVRNWRVLTAVVAVVLAAAASVLAYTYLTQADARAQDKTELVPALVARNVIPKGTPGQAAIDENLLETKRVPRDVLPDAVLTSDQGIGDLVASAAIAKGQFVVRDSFVAPSQVDGFSTAVKDGKQAVSLSVDPTHGVAGFIQPNDSINMLVTMEIEDRVDDAGAFTTTAFVIPGLRVLAVGTTTTNTPAAEPQTDADGDGTPDATAAPVAIEQGLITVEATPRQAAQIAHAMNAGTIMLTLNPPDFDAADFKTPQEIVEATNLFDQPLGYLESVMQQVRDANGGE